MGSRGGKRTPMLDFTAVRRVRESSVVLSLARDAEVEICAGKLLGEQDDLAGVVLEVADDLVDRHKDRRVPPCARGLRIDGFGEALGGQRGDDLRGLIEGRGEARKGFAAAD